MRLVERGRTLHENVVLLTVRHEDVPTVEEANRIEHAELGHGFHRVVVHAGFMEQPGIHDLLAKVAAEHALPFGESEVTYYLGRETLLSTDAGRMGRVAETVYSFLSRNSVAADRMFGIPSEQVIEIGTQIDL
jgi:KUP system potassium uptake protein